MGWWYQRCLVLNVFFHCGWEQNWFSSVKVYCTKLIKNLHSFDFSISKITNRHKNRNNCSLSFRSSQPQQKAPNNPTPPHVKLKRINSFKVEAHLRTIMAVVVVEPDFVSLCCWGFPTSVCVICSLSNEEKLVPFSSLFPVWGEKRRSQTCIHQFLGKWKQQTQDGNQTFSMRDEMGKSYFCLRMVVVADLQGLGPRSTIEYLIGLFWDGSVELVGDTFLSDSLGGIFI